MMFVDSHCHLVFPEFADKLAEVSVAMQAAKVGGALCISTKVEEIAAVVALAECQACWWASAGVHPDTENMQEPDEGLLLDWAKHPKVVAIGETGLDYFRLNGRSVADMEWQRERFRVHIRAALASDLPLVIHTRQASEDTLDILTAASRNPKLRGVFHCFTETREVARAALDLGFDISFSGILTFKNAADLREVASFVPLDRCLIETDSPYLAPVPFRGKTNTPALVPWVAEALAKVKGLPVERIAAATTANFERLFRVRIAGSMQEESLLRAAM